MQERLHRILDNDQMNQEERLAEIVDQCVERLASGETVMACITDYPEHQAELEPLLKVVAATMYAASARPNPHAKIHGLRRLNEALSVRKSRGSGFFGWVLDGIPSITRPLVAALAVALGLYGIVLGADRAAAHSVPGEPLYWIKKSTENLSLMVPKSDSSKAHQHAHLAKLRSNETFRLVRMGRILEAEKHAVTIRIHLGQSAQLIGITMSTNPIEMPVRRIKEIPDSEISRLKSLLARDWEYANNVLNTQLHLMPLDQQEVFKHLMRRQELGYRMFIAMLDRTSVPAGPPFWVIQPH